MKPSIMSTTYMQLPGATLEGMLAFVRETRLSGIDFVQTQELAAPFEETRRRCVEAGISAVGGIVFNPIGAADFSRGKWLETARRGIEATAALGASRVMFPTAGVRGRAREESRKLWMELLSEAVVLGASCGVSVSIESFLVDMEWSPFVSSRDLLEATEAVPGLKVTFDSGNHFVVEDVLKAYRRLSSHVVNVHLKDWEILDAPAERTLRMTNGRFYRMTPIGQGVVDNAAFVDALLAEGRQFDFDLECSGGMTPVEAVRQSWEYLQGRCFRRHVC